MKTVTIVLGIRPDVIRASLIIEYLKRSKNLRLIFIWSGQHYSDNLKNIFFRELKVPSPDIELECKGETDAEISSQLIAKLYTTLQKIKSEAVIFLGDTNTVLGCIAAAQLNIPIIHIEGCMRSFDWRMPEEKYRTVIDHLSDVIYAYDEEYRKLGIAEGINAKNIVVVGNPIVDIIDKYYFSQKKEIEKIATSEFFLLRKINKYNYYLMTCHRRENVHIKKSLLAIMELISYVNNPIYFPASYRTQKVIKEMKIKKPKNLIITDPIGYKEILILMTHAKAVITDSGTLIEEACILNVPSISIRKSTERPQIYDVKSSVKFDPDQPERYMPQVVFKKLQSIIGTKWKHTFGDGKSSYRIAEDIIYRVRNNKLRGHLLKDSLLPYQHAFMDDGIILKKNIK